MEFKNLKNTFKKNYQLFVFIIKKKSCIIMEKIRA